MTDLFKPNSIKRIVSGERVAGKYPKKARTISLDCKEEIGTVPFPKLCDAIPLNATSAGERKVSTPDRLPQHFFEFTRPLPPVRRSASDNEAPLEIDLDPITEKILLSIDEEDEGEENYPAGGVVIPPILPKFSRPSVVPETSNPLAMVKNNPEPMLLTLTSFPFRIVYANDSFERMTGRKDLIGSTFCDVFCDTGAQMTLFNCPSLKDRFDGSVDSVKICPLSNGQRGKALPCRIAIEAIFKNKSDLRYYSARLQQMPSASPNSLHDQLAAAYPGANLVPLSPR